MAGSRSAAAKKAWATRGRGGAKASAGFLRARAAYSHGYNPYMATSTVSQALAGPARDYTKAVHATKVSTAIKKEFARNFGVRGGKIRGVSSGRMRAVLKRYAYDAKKGLI